MLYQKYTSEKILNPRRKWAEARGMRSAAIVLKAYKSGAAVS